MLQSTRPNVRQLRLQLEEYELIVEVNQELFDTNVPAREKLAAKFRAVQIILDRLEKHWDRVDPIILLDDANLIVSEICDDIQSLLSQDTP